MFCPSCGKEIADDSSFCPLCGSQIKSERAKQQGVPSTVVSGLTPNANRDEDSFERIVAQYGDVVTADDLAILLEWRTKLLDTFNFLPLLSFTALVFVLGGVYNSNTFWVVYPALGYFFDFVAVVLFLASFYITYMRGQLRSLPGYFKARYRSTLFAQYIAAKSALESAGHKEHEGNGGASTVGRNRFVKYVVGFRDSISTDDLTLLLRLRLETVVDFVKQVFFGLWVLVLFYLMVWFWFGTGLLEYASGVFATIIFLALLGNALAAFDGGFVNNLRRLSTPSQYQVLLLEDYLQAKRMIRK